jgi:hypothetical protein
MLAALAMIRDSDGVSLSVGADRVELATNRETVQERKVKLPVRWLKGLVEVQACQSRMRPVHDISGLEAGRFLKSLPRMKTNRRETWIVSAGRGLRLSQVETRGAVRVGGLERLRVLEGLVPQARSLQVFADDAIGASGWIPPGDQPGGVARVLGRRPGTGVARLRDVEDLAGQDPRRSQMGSGH